MNVVEANSTEQHRHQHCRAVRPNYFPHSAKVYMTFNLSTCAEIMESDPPPAKSPRLEATHSEPDSSQPVEEEEKKLLGLGMLYQNPHAGGEPNQVAITYRSVVHHSVLVI